MWPVLGGVVCFIVSGVCVALALKYYITAVTRAAFPAEQFGQALREMQQNLRPCQSCGSLAHAQVAHGPRAFDAGAVEGTR